MLRSKKATPSVLFPNPANVFGFLLFTLLFFAAASSTLRAEDSVTSLAAKVETLEKNLSAIEENQKLLLQKQDEILQKLDTVKVWTRRS